MNNAPGSHAPSSPPEKNSVIIIGTNQLQNELFAEYLSTHASVTCFWKNGSDIAAIDPAISGKTPLVLIDCFKTDNQWPATYPLATVEQKFPGCLLGLFNVDANTDLERWAVEKGIRGIFYHNDPLPLIAKGVGEIINGELWYSRKTMSRFLLEKGSFAKLSRSAAIALTFREREILIAIASGARNKEIAEELNISLHTVKTHIYNIYKKIKVPNRLQAAFWAAKYL